MAKTRASAPCDSSGAVTASTGSTTMQPAAAALRKISRAVSCNPASCSERPMESLVEIFAPPVYSATSSVALIHW